MQRSFPQEAKSASIASTESDEDFWLFGYGEDHRGTPTSPGRVVTLIERSFWETLREEPTETPTRVYGAAYHVPTRHIQAVKSYLDIREINGYSIQYAPFIPIPTSTSRSTVTFANTTIQPLIPDCMVYIGLPNNPQFLGKQDPQDVAAVIARSVGPSGRNIEYLFMLEEALEGLADESGDGHVRDLARRVRELMGVENEMKGVAFGADQLAMHAVEAEVQRLRSGEGGKPVEEAERVN